MNRIMIDESPFPKLLRQHSMGGELLVTENNYVYLERVSPSKNRQSAGTCVQTPLRIPNTDVRVACWN